MQSNIVSSIGIIFFGLLGLFFIILLTFGFLPYVLPSPHTALFFVFSVIVLTLHGSSTVLAVGSVFAIAADVVVGSVWGFHLVLLAVCGLCLLGTYSLLSRYMLVTRFRQCLLCVLVGGVASSLYAYIGGALHLDALLGVVVVSVIWGFLYYPLHALIDLWIKIMKYISVQ